MDILLKKVAAIVLCIMCCPAIARSDGIFLDREKGWTDAAGNSLSGKVGTLDAATGVALLLTDIKQPLEIRSSRMVLDGGGHKIFGCEGDPGHCAWVNGILVKDQKDIEISTLEISGFQNGIGIVTSENIDVHDCIVTGNKIGLLSDDSAKFKVHDNSFEKNGLGSIVQASRDSLVLNNKFQNNKWHGIKMSGSENNTIRGNLFNSNGMAGAQFSSGARRNTVCENDFTDNGRYGLLMGELVAQNTVYRNNFVGNHFKHVWVNNENIFSLPPPQGGNFWGEGEYERYPRSYSPTIREAWAAPDEDGDGLVDTPYPVYIMYSSRIGAYDQYPWNERNGWSKHP